VVSAWALVLSARALMDAVNALYERVDRRPFWKQYLVALLLSIAVSGLLVLALAMGVFGSAAAARLAKLTGIGPVLRWAWAVASWPAMIACVLAAFSLAYYF